MRRKILIDTDLGIDDALAILMALGAPSLEVVGLTTVFGNHAAIHYSVPVYPASSAAGSERRRIA